MFNTLQVRPYFVTCAGAAGLTTRMVEGAPGVRIDPYPCTGDGIRARCAPEVFELDIGGLTPVKSASDGLLHEPRATTVVPLPLLRDVADSVRECPGDYVGVRRISDKVEVYGPEAVLRRAARGPQVTGPWSGAGRSDGGAARDGCGDEGELPVLPLPLDLALLVGAAAGDVG